MYVCVCMGVDVYACAWGEAEQDGGRKSVECNGGSPVTFDFNEGEQLSGRFKLLCAQVFM